MERGTSSRYKQIKSLQLASLAHDLRTPMSCAAGAAQLALAAVQQGKDASMQMEQILQAIGAMDSMLAGLCEAPDAKEAFTGEKLSRALLTVTAGACASKGQRLSIDTSALAGLEIYADFSSLTRVLMNLLGNAAKYTPEGGTITLRAEQVRTGWLPGNGRRYLRFIVSDSGMGMKRAFLRRMYAPYERAEESAHLPGRGIGLAGVRQMVRGMGGSIQVRSEPEKGTVFAVTVPAVCVNRT